MPLDRLDQIGLARPGGEAEHGVERIEPEEVAVWLAARRGWPAVADLAEVVLALSGAARQGFLRRDFFVPLVQLRPDVEQDPVNPRLARSVRVVTDQGEALRSRWRISPLQGGRGILAVAGVLPGDGLSLLKSAACQFEGHRDCPPQGLTSFSAAISRF